MRLIIGSLALFVATAAFAQSSAPTSPPANPPMVGDRPLVQIKPKEKPAPKAAATPKAAPGKPTSLAQKLQACLDLEDGTKDRLNCYDTAFPGKPKPPAKGKATPPKTVSDCRAVKEEDERLTCFNGFVEKLPMLPRS